MKKIYFLISLFFCINIAFSQVVFTDNFNVSTGATYTTTVGAIGSSVVWNMNRNGADWGARIDGNILDCTNDGSATANVNGWVFANTSTAVFSSPYSTTLNVNVSTVSWTFNMRQIRTDPAGFGVGSYGVAFILAGSSNDGAVGSGGYAVALGQSGGTDPIRLIKYNNGLQGTTANIITSNTIGLTDFGADYLSIKVTYVPSTDTWELFVRNDGTTAFADPTVGVLTSQGTAIDNTFTGSVLGFMGGYWQGATALNQTAFFDNINVSIASTNSANSDIIADATFITPSNINYSQYQGTALTLVNSIEVAKFTIRDGGAAADADAVGTILNSISFSLSNPTNIRRVAIMDGSTQLAEVAGAATINFTGLALTAPDDGTKDFSLRVVFANNVTDNQQFQFTVTSTSTDFAGSSFAASNAGGATSSITGDDNRVEVIADGLSYLVNTFSPTGNGVAMAPAVQIGGTDTLNFSGNLYTNLDLDFTEQINITSTGTLTGSPVTVTAVAGVATFATLVHTVNGTGLTLNAKRTTTLDWDAVSNPFDIINASNATDYFRSVQNGTWNNPTTWESSADNVLWQPSTLSPNVNANTITIRNPHVVVISADTTADQIIIDAGGVLRQLNTSVFNLVDGAGVDMTINGTYEINGRRPIGLGFIDVNNAGHVLVTSNAAPSESDDFASPILNTRITFKKGSYYDWNVTTSPAWSGQTYLTVGERAIFRFLATPNFGVGGGANTVINGILETLDTLAINGAGSKTFVNGIVGHYLIDASASTGMLQITGDTAILGGVGDLLVPSSLNIGTNSKVFMTDTKTVTGNMSLTSGCRVFLANYDLTVTNLLTGGTSNSYMVTNGTGKLFQRFFTTGLSWDIPIGPTENIYNPIVINDGQNLHYGARVEIGINPTIAVPLNAVNRTWTIVPSGNPSIPVSVRFYYETGHANAGFNYSSTVELAQYTSAWNIIQSPITPSGAYNVTGFVSSMAANVESPYVIGNIGAILAISKKITLSATKQNNTTVLSWQASNISTIKSYVVERSSNGINFTAISTTDRLINIFIDASPALGNNYYRIKCVEQNNAITYSNVMIIRHIADVVSIFPSIGTANTQLTINSIANQKIAVIITDALGKRLSNSSSTLKIGENKLPIQ
ncbi:MAG: hypothetical protein KA319_13790, partial [Ferruginibacter sp.]|nr:hypothetical protein [Ferruginibacter sp.]